MSSWDLTAVMLEGRQAERIEALSFQRVCKCQCVEPPHTNPPMSEGFETDT